MSLVFITGNIGKHNEAKEVIPEIIRKDIDLVEIQEIDPKKIIEHKLHEAESSVSDESFVVEDIPKQSH